MRIGHEGPTGGALRRIALCCIAAAALGGCTAGDRWTRVDGEAEFNQRLAAANGPVMVEFYKGSCPFCWFVSGTLTEVSDEYADRVTFMKIDGPTNEPLLWRYTIKGYPTVILLTDGVERNRWMGGKSKEVYASAIDKALAGTTGQ